MRYYYRSITQYALRNTFRLLFALLLVAVVPTAQGQSRVGTTAAPFLTLGTGARGQALGHAYTTQATGGDALFWNPAGAAYAGPGGQRGSAFFTHFNWIADIDYNAFGVVLPVTGSDVLGLSVAFVDYGRMDVRTEALPEGTGETFGAADMSLGLTYARPLTSSFYFGGSVKYVRQTIRDMAASAVAFDFGFLLETPYLRGARLAASIQNFGGKMEMAGINGQVFVDVDPTTGGNNPNIPARLHLDDWDLPLQFRFGVSVPMVRVAGVQLLALAEANQSNDNNLNGDFGGELSYGNRTYNVYVRGGYKDAFLDNVDSHAALGAGLDVRVTRLRFGFDFAYVPFDRLGATRMVDFRVGF